MNSICLEQACCIFYCVEYNDLNAKMYTDRVKNMEDIQICYLENPNEPILVCNARVFGAPNLYNNYKSREDSEGECEEDDMDKNISFGESESNLIAEILINNKIENGAQIVEFINYVYRPKSEHVKDSPFKLTLVSDKTVLGVLWKYTERFNKTTALGFNQWLRNQNIDFLTQEPDRKVLKIQGSETEKLRVRMLSVLDSQFHDEVADNIVSKIPRHHAYIKQLKDDGYEVIGYCRKSKIESDNRSLLLQRMINILYKRSLVQKVFVSPCSSAKQALSKRDLSDQDILSSLDQINGNTQDFLTYVKKKTKICVVAIDYAGFTTNMSDLKNLLKTHSSIQKIMIDLFVYQNQIKVFDRNQLLNCVEDLKKFNCRPACKQRSK